MATYKPYRKTTNGKEEIKIPYSVLSNPPTIPTKASDVNALSLDGGTINKSKTVKMDASANSDGANLKWGTVNSKNPYIGYASDQVDGTFVVGSLLGTNYASGLAIGGGSGNLLWKGAKVATTSDIPDISGKQDLITENNKLSSSLIDGLATVATSGSYNDLQNIPTDIAKIGNLSNPNLLINPNFAINQRGQASYTGKGYGVDRWKGYQLNAMVCTPNTNGVTLTAPESSTGTGAIYRQIIEPEQVARLAGKTITFSFMATNRGSAGIYMRCLTPASVGDTPNIASGETKIVTKTVTLVADITELQFVFRKSGGTLDVDIHWAKLEIGSVATPFSPPNIAEELPKCQRYYQIVRNYSRAVTLYSLYAPYTNFAPTMRVKPSCKLYGVNERGVRQTDDKTIYDIDSKTNIDIGRSPQYITSFGCLVNSGGAFTKDHGYMWDIVADAEI